MLHNDRFDEDEDTITGIGDDYEGDETLEELTTDEDGHLGTHRGRTREDEFEPEYPDFDEAFRDDFDDEEED